MTGKSPGRRLLTCRMRPFAVLLGAVLSVTCSGSHESFAADQADTHAKSSAGSVPSASLGEAADAVRNDSAAPPRVFRVLSVKSGEIYRGLTRDGVPDGIGVSSSNDGTIYAGEWEAGA